MGLNVGALLWSCEEGRDSLILLGLGRRLAAEVLRRERPAGQEASARASSQSQFTEPAVVLQQLWGGDVAATKVILSLILTILVVTRRCVSECVIVGSESMCVRICGCLRLAGAVSAWGVTSWVCVLPLMGQ